MTVQPEPVPDQRTPLSADRVHRAAIELADAEGIAALTMRSVAGALGVEAMSLYYHVANKETLLDGVVDTLVQEIEAELGGFQVVKGKTDWRTALRNTILVARTVMLRHPWAPTIIDTRTTMTFTLIRYFDSLLGIMIEGGFTNDLGHHAMHVLGSRALGFNKELFEPDDPEQADEETDAMLADLAPQLPYLVAMLADVAHDPTEDKLGWCDDQSEFEFALDLILDGLETRRISTTTAQD